MPYLRHPPRPSRAAAVLLLLAAAGCAPALATPAGGRTRRLAECGPVRVGGAAPVLSGWTLDNAVVTLDRLLRPSGKPVRRGLVVSFFATWCVPCRPGLQELARVAPALGAQGVHTLLVAVPPEVDGAAALLARLGVRLPTLVDPYGKNAERYGIAGGAIPRTFVLDSRGQMVAIFGEEGCDFAELLLRALPAGGR